MHGGLLPRHLEYYHDNLNNCNKETKEYITDANARIPATLGKADAVVWARDYSRE